MPVERAIYKIPFCKGYVPEWTCPTCGRGKLEGKKGSFQYEMTKESRDSIEDAPDPFEIEYVYSCVFLCSNERCNEVVCNVGIGNIDEEAENVDDEGNPVSGGLHDIFYPKFFQPHLKIINFPQNVPGGIRKEIDKSFELFFADPSSASNHIRVALEYLLDYFKVKRHKTIHKKRVPMSLHERILMVPAKWSFLKDQLLAVKWLGNAGSHASGVTIDDVMDAYDILEVVFSEVFSKKDSPIKKIVKQINRKKGPRNS